MLFVKRLLAYWLDFVLLASLLVGLQWLLYAASSGFPFDRLEKGYQIELWVLLSMSLPVWCYFIYFERRHGHTPGKRLLKLKVTNNKGRNLSFSQALVRTGIRLLPWELTHLFILVPEPWWNVAEPKYPYLIYIPNALMVLYIVILMISGGKRGIHDIAANTAVKSCGNMSGC